MNAEPDRLFERLVANIPGMVVYLDRFEANDPTCSHPVYISPQVEDLLGYDLSEWLGEGELWLDVLHPDDRERMAEADVHARATLSPLAAEYRMIARDGRVVWVSEKASVVEDQATGVRYWQGVMIDITDRKRAEEALAASERQFRSVFDAASMGLVTVALDGRVLEANSVVEEILGYRPGCLRGVVLFAAEAVVEIAAGRTDRCELEHQLPRGDGALLWCRTVMSVVRDAEGRPEHVTAMVEDIDDRKRVEAELLHRTIHDSLTALPNRAHFLGRLAQSRLSAVDAGFGVGVVFIDLDDFKAVNDSFGHAVGDELLVAIARRLENAMRPTDLVARFGGDEFLVLADRLDSARDAGQVAWRLAGALRSPFAVGGREIVVTASFGVAFASEAEGPDEDLVRMADAAMYQAKQRGRNRVAVFGEPESAGAVA
jgi:diguanylate cyclase (GGDEF)-like protein/PAS domain S-box-containing protein